jgi:hypothetical protein
MKRLDESQLRDLFERAVAPLDPVAPPLDLLRERAVKLRRFRISAGGAVLAAAAAAVTVAVVVVPANGTQGIRVSSAPSRTSLTTYASAHGGKHVAGPVKDGTHYVGAYATKQAIVVVRYASGSWHADGRPITTYGPGKFVQRLADGGAVIPGDASFAMRYIGGDVSYYGGVFYDDHGTWVVAQFGRCSNKNTSCHYAGDTEPYGHVAHDRFVSIHNDCKPYCAAGTDYRVVWHWVAGKRHFAAVSETPIKN